MSRLMILLSTREVVSCNLALVMATAVLLWLWSLRSHDVSVVDIVWGLLFVVIAWFTFLATPGASARKLAIVLPVTVWGLRLAVYLAWRNAGKAEDYRYQAMRQRIGPRFRWLSLFTVFLLQAVLAWIVSLPVQLGQLGAAGQPDASAMSPTPLQLLGAVVFIVGLVFETVGDIQLARFKADAENVGQVMDRGLWRYTRHPNYFGDFMVWWGLFFLSLATLEDVPRMAWTALGPLLMSFLLVRVSGVALLEKSLKQRRPAYRDYIRRTSSFLPWPPKS